MAYQAPANPRNPEDVSRQMTSDPRVQQAYGRYRETRNQADFIAYLDAIKPYTSQIDQNRYGIDPETGVFRGTSNYGHWWKMGAGMATGVALPYGPYAGAGSSGAQKAADYVGDDMYDAASSGGGQDWWKVIRSVIPAVAPLVGRAVTGGGDPSSSSPQIPPELSQLLKLQTDRIQQSQPNYETMLRMVSGMMPRWARQPQAGAPPQPSMDPSMAAIIQRMAVPRG